MTNEFKARVIAQTNSPIWSNKNIFEECYQSAVQMAEWKDKQFKKYLEKKRNEVNQCEKCSIGLFPNDVIRYNGAIEIINEIINELFEE